MDVQEYASKINKYSMLMCEQGENGRNSGSKNELFFRDCFHPGGAQSEEKAFDPD